MLSEPQHRKFNILICSLLKSTERFEKIVSLFYFPLGFNDFRYKISWYGK